MSGVGFIDGQLKNLNWDGLGVRTGMVCRPISGVGFVGSQLKSLNWDGLGVRTGMVCRPVSGVGFVGSQLKSLNWDGLGVWMGVRVCHHHHQFLNREGRWGTTDDFATSFLHFSQMRVRSPISFCKKAFTLSKTDFMSESHF